MALASSRMTWADVVRWNVRVEASSSLLNREAESDPPERVAGPNVPAAVAADPKPDDPPLPAVVRLEGLPPLPKPTPDDDDDDQ